MKHHDFRQQRALSMLFAASLMLALSVCATGAQASGAQAESTMRQPSKSGKGTWRVLVSKQTPRTFSVKANDARVSEIANEIGRRLKVPVNLSPQMQKRLVTLDFSALTLDAALRMLAAKPYIDYEAEGGGASQPEMSAIYLYALNETPPASSVALRNNSEAVVVEGHTEDGVEDSASKKKTEEEEPLVVSFAQHQLSVRARKQPLSAVLYKIAAAVGVPFEMRSETNESVDIEFTNYTLEEAVRALPPSVRFYFRTDLQNFETQPLRFALAPTETTQP